MNTLGLPPPWRDSDDETILRSASCLPWHLDDSIMIVSAGGYDWPLVDTGGRGPTLIMLPGAVGTCEMFFKQLKALGDSIRIISISYPAESSPEKLADGLAALMSKLDIPHASVLGSSFGSYWAQFLALRHSTLIDTLFLGNSFVTADELITNPLFDPNWVRHTDAVEIQLRWKEQIELAPTSELKSIQLDMLSGRQSPENLKSRFLGVIAARTSPRLSLDPKRIVIIDTEDDPLISARSRQAVRDQYSGAVVFELNAGGHYPHILNQTAYDDIIRQMLG